METILNSSFILSAEIRIQLVIIQVSAIYLTQACTLTCFSRALWFKVTALNFSAALQTLFLEIAPH